MTRSSLATATASRQARSIGLQPPRMTGAANSASAPGERIEPDHCSGFATAGRSGADPRALGIGICIVADGRSRPVRTMRPCSGHLRRRWRHILARWCEDQDRGHRYAGDCRARMSLRICAGNARDAAPARIAQRRSLPVAVTSRPRRRLPWAQASDHYARWAIAWRPTCRRRSCPDLVGQTRAVVLRDWEPHDPREERNLRIEAWLIGIALAAALVWSLGGSNISLF